MTVIPRSYFDTRTVPKSNRIKQWSDAAAPVWEIVSVENDAFFSVVDLYKGGELVFGTVGSSPQSTVREISHISEDEIDYYALQFYNSGHRRASARGSDVYLRNGDLLTIDMSQPISTVSSRYRSLDIGIPRRLLAPLLSVPNGHGGHRHDGSLPLVSLLRSHVEALYRAAPYMTVSQMETIQPATVALAAAALNGLIVEEHTKEIRAATLFAIQRYIEDHLSNLGLTSSDVCRNFSISRATLYRTMQPVGGFISYLRRRRLHRCRHLLATPGRDHLSISELGESWGFTSHSSFTKLFKEQFGMSPRAYRGMLTDASTVPNELGVTHSWSEWLANMR